MRDALEGVLLHGALPLAAQPQPSGKRTDMRRRGCFSRGADDESVASLRAVRDGDADVLLPSAYVALEFGQSWRDALEESFRCVLRAHGLEAAYDSGGGGGASDEAEEASPASGVTPYQRAIALCVASLRDRTAAALADFDREVGLHASRFPHLSGGHQPLNTLAALMRLPSAHTGAGTDGEGAAAACWRAEASAGDLPRDVMPERIADALAAPHQPSSVVSAAVRSKLAAPLDARLSSRVAAMHRMALRAFAKAAAVAVAPEDHPEAPECLRTAASVAPPRACGELRSLAANLRRAGRPTPQSRALLKAWMQAHVLPSAAHPHGPFPSAAEKEALAGQSGLSVNQVSDWFVNARARWWKPLVEGMHRGLCAQFAREGSTPLHAVQEETEEIQSVPRRRRSSAYPPVAFADAIAGKAPPMALRRRSSRGGSGASEDLEDVIGGLGLNDV